MQLFTPSDPDSTLRTNRRALLVALGAAAVAPRLATGAMLPPGDSIYQLPVQLTDQDGRAFDLASLRGTPVLFSMFYTSCEMVCPMIFETIHATLKSLPAADAQAVRVLMVSFDPARDSVDVLKKTAQAHGCDERWTLARTDDGSVRKLAAALGYQYRRLSNGEFNHSSLLELLDREGRVAAKSGKLGGADPALVKATQLAAARRA